MQKSPLRVTLAAILLSSLGVLGGCAEYSEIGPKAYEYSKALYSVCNRKDSSRLTLFVKQINDAREKSQLTLQEMEWLEGIVATAEAGDWQEATKSARRLMEAQIEGW